VAVSSFQFPSTRYFYACSIAAASVIAKVTRDRIMVELDAKYPDYGFAVHKGYPTPAHKAAIAKHGPCDVHRRTFAPLKVWFPLPQSEPEAERKVKTKSTASRKRAARA
jgi:ribonuclease HII